MYAKCTATVTTVDTVDRVNKHTWHTHARQAHLYTSVDVLLPRYKSASRQQAVTTRRSSHPLPPRLDRPLPVHSFLLHGMPFFLSCDVCVSNISRRHTIVTHRSTLHTHGINQIKYDVDELSATNRIASIKYDNIQRHRDTRNPSKRRHSFVQTVYIVSKIAIRRK